MKIDIIITFNIVKGDFKGTIRKPIPWSDQLMKLISSIKLNWDKLAEIK